MDFSPGWLYKWCQQNDEWPGESYDGTSALGLMKALKERGYITEYRWAFDVETITNWVLTSGPALFGSDWTLDMCRPSEDTGFISATGESVGGHQYMIVGVSVTKECPDGSRGAFRIVNSWGRGWGQYGRAWLSLRDAKKLLHNNGDCVTAKELDLDKDTADWQGV